MQEVPEAGKKEKKVRPHWGILEGHPGGTWGSQGTAAVSTLSASRATSQAGQGDTVKHEGLVQFDQCYPFILFEHTCHSVKLTVYLLSARHWSGRVRWREHQKKPLTLPACVCVWGGEGRGSGGFPGKG